MLIEKLRKSVATLRHVGSSTGDATIPNARHLVLGFGVVIAVLFVAGIGGWLVLSGQSRAFERYSAAGDVENLMYDARLHELIYTRDGTEEAAEQSREIAQSVIKRALELQSIVEDDARSERLARVVEAVEKYREAFERFVLLRQDSADAVNGMVAAAIEASNSAESLQKVQEKYVRLDTESVRKLRQQAEEISENAADSYELIVHLEAAREFEKNFLLSGNQRELQQARSHIATLVEVMFELKKRIRNPRSIELLENIEEKQLAYLDALPAVEALLADGREFTLSSPELIELDQAAFALRDSAYALRSNERAVLSQIQREVADTQELLARRLALSEEVNEILIDVGNARQSDRDFSLATYDEARKVHAQRVQTLLSGVMSRGRKIEGLLIEDDEKAAFERVLPNILAYDEHFKHAVAVALEASRTGQEMVASALEADRLLDVAQASRLDDVKSAESWKAVFVPIAVFFGLAIVLLTILILKSQQTLVNMAKMLRESSRKAEEATVAKSNFLANMSHELRTPMNAILGYSEMLIEEAEDDGQDDYIPDLKKIHHAGNHLLSLINDVLDLSKVEAGKMEAFGEPVVIDNLIDQVTGTIQPLIDKNGNRLVVERGDGLGTAYQDLTKVRQTVFNLLSNAAKFTHEGIVTLRVERIEREGTDWLSIAVSDTGIGIAKDKLDSVFDEFTQADGSTTRDYGGTGLGLAISRRFCALLGGDLSVTSTVGEGSTFTMSIPVNLPGSKPPVDESEPATIEPLPPPPVVPAASAVADPGPGSGNTVLVIDDDPTACDLIERNLMKDGFRVAKATSGEEGLRLAHRLKPVAITLDVMMPGMDGWSVLRALKADPTLCHIPVVMLTMIDDRTRGYSLGAVDYLTKPVDRERLQQALGQYAKPGLAHTVLVVDDDADARELMANILGGAGWNVAHAGNGKEALEILNDASPQLIILDLMMPVMDGFEFISALRKLADWRHVPVVVVTAKELNEDDRARLNGMVEEVLRKDSDQRSELLERVRQALSPYAKSA